MLAEYLVSSECRGVNTVDVDAAVTRRRRRRPSRSSRRAAPKRCRRRCHRGWPVSLALYVYTYTAAQSRATRAAALATLGLRAQAQSHDVESIIPRAVGRPRWCAGFPYTTRLYQCAQCVAAISASASAPAPVSASASAPCISNLNGGAARCEALKPWRSTCPSRLARLVRARLPVGWQLASTVCMLASMD